MPSWSTESHALRLMKAAPVYAGFTPKAISWESSVSTWLPGMAGDGLAVGVKRCGLRATGYDLTPAKLRWNLEAVIALQSRDQPPPVRHLFHLHGSPLPSAPRFAIRIKRI